MEIFGSNQALEGMIILAQSAMAGLCRSPSKLLGCLISTQKWKQALIFSK